MLFNTKKLFYLIFFRSGFKTDEQNTENKNASTHDRPFLIIIRAFTTHMKDFTPLLLTSISQSLLWPARSALYQAPLKLSSKVTALLHRVQSTRPAGRARLGVYVVARGLHLLLHGAQSSLGRFRHQRAHYTRKKHRHHVAWCDMSGRRKA